MAYIILILCIFIGGNNHKYASNEAKVIVTKMINAHGGYNTFALSPSVCFKSHLKVNFGNGYWSPFWEEVMVETQSRKVYAKLPNADGSFGEIAYDGSKAWSHGTLKGISKAPPRFTAWRNFYLFMLPWMTQDAGVILKYIGLKKLSLNNSSYHVIEMRFKEGIGDTSKDHYKLYIDPKTYQLYASEYVMTYPGMVQKGRDESLPSIFVWEQTINVQGLIVPKKYTVYWSHDKSVAVKDGTIDDWSFSTKFDKSKLEMPDHAVIDRSLEQ